ncbi:unnamed protein product [Lactuca virosa]|uniref:Uncharacterized protein n=1 Tax=Lactuca virosa TaxID=75947 RepID=A0AAU9PG29_9ASTR|nr:unnamed protein product [Lactuca virosa]
MCIIKFAINSTVDGCCGGPLSRDKYIPILFRLPPPLHNTLASNFLVVELNSGFWSFLKFLLLRILALLKKALH